MRRFTDEELARMGLDRSEIAESLATQNVSRGWSTETFQVEFAKREMTIGDFERAVRLQQGAVTRSLIYCPTDHVTRIIANFLNVSRAEIWPNYFFQNDVKIPKEIKAAEMSDEALADLNARVMESQKLFGDGKITIASWDASS